MNRLLIDARVRIDEVRPVRRVLDAVCTISRSESHEACAIKVHAVVVNEIRVLIGIAAAGAKPNLAIVFVDALDAADDIVALGDLVFDRSILGVDQIDMPPAIALGNIKDLVGLLEPRNWGDADVFGVSSPDERVSFFVDQIAAATAIGIDLDQPQALMTAIDLLIGEAVTVVVPANVGSAKINPIDAALDFLLLGHIEDVQLVGREFVAREGVGAGVQNGPAAAARR